jgi:hypothetical protein
MAIVLIALKDVGLAVLLGFLITRLGREGLAAGEARRLEK